VSFDDGSVGKGGWHGLSKACPCVAHPHVTRSEVNQHWTEVCLATYFRSTPRKYGHTTKPRMTFH
jgi:hypothetical protein